MADRMQESIHRVAVIGAGVSGLATIKSCLEESIQVDCYELTSDLGGLWKLRDSNHPDYGGTCVMQCTVMHSCKEMAAYSDFPPPKEFPVFMPHNIELQYLQLYAQHFELIQHIKFRHKVLNVHPTDDHEESGNWNVEVRDMNEGKLYKVKYNAVAICTGRNCFPRSPRFMGQDSFKGRWIHSNEYKYPQEFAGKRVLVVGLGNAGGDIATELSRIAKKVYLSTRHGCWMFPRIGPDGRPMDTYLFRRDLYYLRKFSTYNLSSRVIEYTLNSMIDHDLLNLRPKHRLLSQFPLINDQLAECILNGTVSLVGGIQNFTNSEVVLDSRNGQSTMEIDVVILATGFDTDLSSTMKDMLPFDLVDNLRTFKRVFPLDQKHSTLAFVGMIGTFGPLIPTLEIQARWVVSVFAGKTKLPSQKVMKNDVKTYVKMLDKRIYDECYHRDQIDWMQYMQDLSSFIGAKPNLMRMLFRDPPLFWRCLMGPCLPYSFRLEGPHKWSGAKDAILNSKKRLVYSLKNRVDRVENVTRL